MSKRKTTGTRKMRPDPKTAYAIAQQVAASRQTCEGCAALRKYPRPMCRSEASPHFRTARDTYHDRCASYSVIGKTAEPGAQPEPPRAANNLQVVYRGRGA